MKPAFYCLDKGASDALYVDVYGARTESPHAVVLFVHGFKGFRQWGFFPEAAKRIADAGLTAITLDLSSNGMRGTDDRVIDGEAFTQQTITKDLIDAFRFLHWLFSDSIRNKLPELRSWDGTLHLVGHSRGGALVHLIAKQMLNSTERHGDLGRCVAWNTIGTYTRWTARQRAVWQADGAVKIENSRTGQQLFMGAAYPADIENNHYDNALIEAARQCSDRFLYVHGDQDVTVPLHEVKQFLASAESASPIQIVKNTGHTFGIVHPWQGSTTAFDTVMNATLKWLQ